MAAVSKGDGPALAAGPSPFEARLRERLSRQTAQRFARDDGLREQGNHTKNTVDPVVLRAARSAWALAASFSG
jgi:hypothetical protein